VCVCVCVCVDVYIMYLKKLRYCCSCDYHLNSGLGFFKAFNNRKGKFQFLFLLFRSIKFINQLVVRFPMSGS
jgi:hypothetical protein